MASLYGKINSSRRKALLDRFQLIPAVKMPQLFKGNRQKVALVAAFLVDAELHILDEPTSGLDPLMEQVFQECVFELKKQERPFFLQSYPCRGRSLVTGWELSGRGKSLNQHFEELRHLTRTTVTVELASVNLKIAARGLRCNPKWREVALFC